MGACSRAFIGEVIEYEKFPIGKLENSITIFASKFGWFCCVQYHPNDYAIFVSLTSWDGLSELTLFSDFSGFMDRFYVGIENYKEILTSKEFYQVIGNTLEFVILYIPLMLIASMIVALILNSHVKGVGIFRVLYPGYHLMGCGRIDLEMGS